MEKKRILKTDRLHITPMTADALARKIAETADPELKAAYGEMLEGCRQAPQDFPWYTDWALTLTKAPEQVIGDLCFKGPPADGGVEIGYGMEPDFEGQGYMTEAVKAAVRWALSQPGVSTVYAETAPDNAASQRVLEKAGFRPCTGDEAMGEEGPRFRLDGSAPQPDLRGLTVFLTGGSDGMGFQMARALLTHGAAVVIAARGGEKLEKARQRLEETGGSVYALEMDVRDKASVAAAAAWFRDRFDRLDLLINNAGIGNNAPGMAGVSRFWEVPADTFRNVTETDFTGYFLVSRAFVPMMLEAGRGKIVNVSTSTPTMTRSGMIPYGPARAGAEALSMVMAAELREYGITVNVICPGGATDTGMATEAMREAFRLGGMKMLPPDILNRVILFLASPEAGDMTGEKLIGKEFDAWLAARNIQWNGPARSL